MDVAARRSRINPDNFNPERQTVTVIFLPPDVLWAALHH